MSWNGVRGFVLLSAILGRNGQAMYRAFRFLFVLGEIYTTEV